MKRIPIIIGIGLLAFVLILPIPTAFAQLDFDGPPEEGGPQKQRFQQKMAGYVDRVMEELNLTPEQKAEIKEQQYQNQLKNIDILGRLAKNRMKLQHELGKPQVDELVIREVVENIKTLQGTMVENHVNSILAMKKVLTHEQFEKLHQVHERTKHNLRKHLVDFAQESFFK